ncbi:MAG: hypothetical protein KME20_27240 [Kaiparowitsia implicata GSE-PSE-MK54-09C]|jgi:hypothetical protein|nr:hypothetical protein [Kaiparowitsia implicata GSE-PSE-MK54-09C]
MLTLLLVLTFIFIAGLAATGLLLSAEDQSAGPEAGHPHLSDFSQAKPR